MNQRLFKISALLGAILVTGVVLVGYVTVVTLFADPPVEQLSE